MTERVGEACFDGSSEPSGITGILSSNDQTVLARLGNSLRITLLLVRAQQKMFVL